MQSKGSMMRKTTTGIIAAAILAAFAGAALAAQPCTSEPKAKWMSDKDFRAKVEGQGYKVKRIKTEGSCYEVHGENKAGKKVEAYFNRVDAILVKEEG